MCAVVLGAASLNRTKKAGMKNNGMAGAGLVIGIVDIAAFLPIFNQLYF